ncbi:phosphopantetheine-binding protein [Corallococcus sp. 4LFB]|uniref:acyl carrier protein n=1 Tax=Corallococcus sp. 4LFB TaxID=3383249 RepID=UPI0039771129
MSAHSSQQSVTASSTILEQVRQCAASVTRYPLDILTEHAQLEDELGIDSVKLAEIAAVIAREFHLPPDRLPRNGKARTLGAIAGAVTEALGTAPSPSLHVAPAQVAPVASAQPQVAPLASAQPQVAHVASAQLPVTPVASVPAIVEAKAAPAPWTCCRACAPCSRA